MHKSPFTNNPFVSREQAEELLERLRSSLPEATWLPILKTFEITGVLDTDQLQAVSGLDRMPLTRFLEKLESQRAGLPAIFQKLEQEVRRPTSRGRAPKVFTLGESGASLLQLFGYEEARACKLNTDTAITHALAMVDVHLAAKRAGQQLFTDQTIPYGDERVLRPDHQIQNNEKTQLIEVEQFSSSDTLRRVVNSLEHKQDFFESLESAGFERTVLMLIQLKRGPEYERTLKTWKQAIQLVEKKTGKALNFRMLVLPLGDFMSAPDWAGTARQDWLDLTKPETSLEKSVEPGNPAPRELLKCTFQDDRIILGALWQDFLENAEKRLAEKPRPDPEFLQLLRLVYSASYDPALPVLEQAALPYASIYLLNRYLTMRNLRPTMQKALHAGRGNLRWNPTTILHRMQVVANVFMGIHGWRTDGPLFISATVSSWDSLDGRTFAYFVDIRNPEILLRPGDMLMPIIAETQHTQKALSWVLVSFFAYSVELGLGRVEFW